MHLLNSAQLARNKQGTEEIKLPKVKRKNKLRSLILIFSSGKKKKMVENSSHFSKYCANCLLFTVWS